MLQYSLDEFILTVPSCPQTTTLAVVLDMFELQNCDRLVVINEQQYPIGLLYSAHLFKQLLTVTVGHLDLQEKLITIARNVIQPIEIISAKLSWEELSQVLSSPESRSKMTVALAVVSESNKYLGLIDSPRLLKHLAAKFLSNKVNKISSENQKQTKQTNVRHRKKSSVAAKSLKTTIATENENKIPHYHSLVRLLEHLPWPLMLQTASGEIVAQNPAWWQQLGMLKDPEGVRQEVEEILFPKAFNQSQMSNPKHFLIASDSNSSDKSNISSPVPEPGEQTSHRCFFDSQIGTCTCVVEVQSGQERVWQFAKIPLDSPELKTLSPDLATALEHQGSLKVIISQPQQGNQEYIPLQSKRLHSHEKFHSLVTPLGELWLMLATDVTEQQQLSKELAAKNADLIQLNRLKDEFLACISHELKTPLTAVLGLSRLLIDQQLGELNERQARYAGLIHQSGRHLMSVVNDILDLTRMETGQMELSLGLVKIKAVCDRAVSDAQTMHSQTNKVPANQNHQFSLTIEPGLEEIIADELRLRQMLVHLLSNAFKFTEGGGKIGLRISHWEGWIAFTVWDTGIGIPEHQQHLIFQKFQQLENPLTRQFEGTGLGLVLTRALARLHGGDVSFLSREGKGSQFTLLLPPSPPKTGFNENLSNSSHSLREPSPEFSSKSKQKTSTKKQIDRSSFLSDDSKVNVEEASVNKHLHHSGNSSHRLILVVEAVGRYIEEITEQLTGLGYRVAIARSGCEAVEKARRLQPKAIFLNPVLPLLSGWDVLTLLKSEDLTRRIPVIVTATGAEREQAFANRADGFLRLPVQHQMLSPLLDSLCGIPEVKKNTSNSVEAMETNTPLRILRLVNPDLEPTNQPSLFGHRVIEVDDFEQAELLSRVWQFDVVLLDTDIQIASSYLEHLSKHPRLSQLPLVTCNVEVSQAASQISGLSVFPCLATLSTEDDINSTNNDTLMSVLQIAAGICCPPNILVVDLTSLPDLPKTRNTHLREHRVEKYSNTNGNYSEEGLHLESPRILRASEWFKALIQYLQTGGLKASMARSWAELLQQIRHHSVDLILIYLGESASRTDVVAALNALEKLPFHLPPLLIIDQRLNTSTSEEQPLTSLSTQSIPNAIAFKVLSRSISMEGLLNEIHHALKEDRK